MGANILALARVVVEISRGDKALNDGGSPGFERRGEMLQQ